MTLVAKQRATVHGRRMAYIDTGEGEPTFVLLHGNPTSSYLWRDVIAHLHPLGRCVAPDLIGMGDSDKLPDPGPGAYRFTHHRRHLDGLLDAVDLPAKVVLVVHDWGSALGFDWARRHPERVAGIAYMEAIVRPMRWDDWRESTRPVFEALRSPAGEQMVLDDNAFVEQVLPRGILRELTEDEMAEYRRPFATPGEDRRPTLDWPRELPLDGEPADVVAIVDEYARWLSASDVPKLFVNADPGAILLGAQRDFCRAWPNQREVTVRGIHFVQEDSPHEIGEAIASWAADLAG
jgi:haloalkane dehalogenase